MHEDMSYSSRAQNVKLKFYWAPQLNKTYFDVRKYLERLLRKKKYIKETIFQALRTVYESQSDASLLVTGSATHSIKDSNNSLEALEKYEKAIVKLKPVSFFLTFIYEK